jgi:plastocyanin
MTLNRLAVLALSALLVTASAALGATTHTIDALIDATFSPSTITIQVGDTVNWRNVGGGFHDVVADDGTFNNLPPSSANWTFSHTFNQAGTFGYHCDQHGGPGSGMFGTITVQGAGPQPQPGTLRFAQASYSVSEGAGSINIAVSRVNGADGAVSISYAAAAGTATSGADFTATSGTLSWADGDASNKTFNVPIANDTTQEPNETVLLSLSSPTGGAVLDNARKAATLTIIDDDAPASGPPAAPSALQIIATFPAEIHLAWNDNSNNETEFRIEQKVLGGSFAEVGTVPANTATFTAPGLLSAKQYIFRVRAAGSGGTFSTYSNEASAATDTTPAPCVADAATLCLSGGRFKAQLAWRSDPTTTGQGSAVPIPSAPDSGLFFFFSPGNLEMLIKTLNGCGLNDKLWVFYAATTNVEFTLTLTDTMTGKVKVYFNPLGTAAAPVQDTSAFATCP